MFTKPVSTTATAVNTVIIQKKYPSKGASIGAKPESPPDSNKSKPTRPFRNLIEINDGGLNCRTSALPDFYVVPHCGHWSAPRVLAALVGVVHDRQRADD